MLSIWDLLRSLPVFATLEYRLYVAAGHFAIRFGAVRVQSENVF